MVHKWKKINIILCIFVVLLLCVGFYIMSKGDYEEYLKTATFPNCMAVDDYGVDGNEEGVVKKTRTKTEDYLQIYGLLFETYYMKDEKFAAAKFDKLIQLENILSVEKEITPNGKSVVKVFKNEDVIYFVLNNKTVHRAAGPKGNDDKNLRWFETIAVDYTNQI